MSADPKKLAAMVVEGLPPPDRLKKPPMDDEEAEGEGMGGGESAMSDFLAASKNGDPAGMLTALKTAIEYCKE